MPKLSLSVSQSCGTNQTGTINASAADNIYVPAGSTSPYVTIYISGESTGFEHYSSPGQGSTSVTVNNLPNDVYQVTATSTSSSTSTSKPVTITCAPVPDIVINPTYILPATLNLDIASNLVIKTDTYTGNTIPGEMTSWTKTKVNDRKITAVGVINQNLNYLTVGVTVTDSSGYSEHLDIHWAKATYIKHCGANQSGSYTATKTAFSTVSVQDATDKAMAAARIEADAKLICDTDIKFREVQMIDLSFTVSYSLEAKCWTGFHDYIPDAIFCTANRVMSFKDQEIYLHNQRDRKGIYYNQFPIAPVVDVVPFKSQIEFVVSNLLTKAYHAINWKSQYKTEGVINERKTFTAIMMYNHNQCSGEQPITLKKTTRNAEGVWRFNEFRDLLKDPNTMFLDRDGNVIPASIMANKSFFKKSRFIGDYLCVRMIFDNAESLPEIVLSDFSINDKVSYR